MKVELRDFEEWDLNGSDPELRAFVSVSSKVFVGEIDGKIACIWGLVPPTLLSNHAHLWMWTNDLCAQHPFLLVRYSQIAMKEMLKIYPTIVGYCDLNQKRSCQWLKWLGATIAPARGRLAPFEIRAQNG